MKKLIAGLFTLLFTTSVLASDSEEKVEIIETVNSIGFYADMGEWDKVADQFDPDGVVIDYTSYQNASAGTEEAGGTLLTPDQVVAAWQTVLPGYEHTRHVQSNHIVDVDGDKASVVSSIHATHILPNDEGEDFWIFLGDYYQELAKTDDGWKVTLMRANLRAEQGDSGLLVLAMDAVKARQAEAAAEE